MQKPSDEIVAIQDLVIAERVKEMLTQPGTDFMMKISGTTEENMRDSLKRDPHILMAAVVMYLDLEHERRNRHDG